MASRFFGSELALYPDKTKFILFNPSRKQINPDHSIFIDGNKITIVEQTKFLGFIIHQNLSWQPHIKDHLSF